MKMRYCTNDGSGSAAAVAVARHTVRVRPKVDVSHECQLSSQKDNNALPLSLPLSPSPLLPFVAAFFSFSCFSLEIVVVVFFSLFAAQKC